MIYHGFSKIALYRALKRNRLACQNIVWYWVVKRRVAIDGILRKEGNIAATNIRDFEVFKSRLTMSNSCPTQMA